MSPKRTGFVPNAPFIRRLIGSFGANFLLGEPGGLLLPVTEWKSDQKLPLPLLLLANVTRAPPLIARIPFSSCGDIE